jgi:hypothetical protein
LELGEKITYGNIKVRAMVEAKGGNGNWLLFYLLFI